MDAPPVAIETQVRIDKLRLLYRQSFPALFVSLIIAGLLARILWHYDQSERFLVWFGVIVATSAVRLMLFLMYRRASPSGEAVLAWERPYAVTLCASSAVWGLGCPLIVPADDMFYQAIVFYFLMGMAGGAFSVYAANRFLTLITVFIVLGPFTLWMFLQGASLQIYMALASVIFLVSAVRATGVMSTALNNSFVMTHQLVLAKENAEGMARTDPLTGVMNRRAFVEEGMKLLDVSIRNRRPVTMIVLDLDHFKSINDNHGHGVGDLALVHVAKIVRESVRETDICARLGGEEFAVLLPNTIRDHGLTLAEKLRTRISSNPLKHEAREYPLTASFGVAEGAGTLESVLTAADEAMYRAKRAGRNKVAV